MLMIKLRMSEVMVIIDALRGSARIVNGDRIFAFKSETMLAIADKLLSYFDKVAVVIECPEEDNANPT